MYGGGRFTDRKPSHQKGQIVPVKGQNNNQLDLFSSPYSSSSIGEDRDHDDARMHGGASRQQHRRRRLGTDDDDDEQQLDEAADAYDVRGGGGGYNQHKIDAIHKTVNVEAPIASGAYINERPTQESEIRHRFLHSDGPEASRSVFVNERGDTDHQLANQRQRLDTTRMKVVTYTFVGDYPFSWLMYIDMLMALFYVSILITSLFTVTTAFTIDSSKYLVAGTVVQGFFSVLMQMLPSLAYWWKREDYGFTHAQLLYTTAPVYFNLPLMIVAWFVLGQWVWNNVPADERFNTAAAQPIANDAGSLATYLATHAILAFASLIALIVVLVSVYWHMRPEVSLTVAERAFHVSELEKSRIVDAINGDDEDKTSEFYEDS